VLLLVMALLVLLILSVLLHLASMEHALVAH
jgi:hypothetical protein